MSDPTSGRFQSRSTSEVESMADPIEAWQKPEVGYLSLDGESVLVAGRLVPHLTAHHNGGQVVFAVGGNAVSCDMTLAEQVARVIASALAVGAGYVGWPEPDGDFVTRPFAPRMTEMSL